MEHKQYNTVKLKEIKKQFYRNDMSVAEREPRVGDIAAIVEVYENPSLGYELECVDKNGITQWLATFSPDDAEFELVNEYT